MGIRINKVLGYGITDLETNDGVIVDKRFNLNNAYFDFEEDEDIVQVEPQKELSVDGYMSFLTEKISSNKNYFSMDYVMLKQHLKKNEEFSILKSFVYDAESEGGENIFCLVPVSLQNEWIRTDDSIDYFEAVIGEPADFSPKVKLLNDRSGIYPYQGSVDKRTGRILPLGDVQDWLRFKDSSDDSLINLFTNSLGFSSVEEADDNITMKPNQDIVDLLEFSGLLSDMKHVYDFKPMIYTYWA